MIISRSIHIGANDIISIFFNGWIRLHWLYVPNLFYQINSFVDGHLGCFSLLTIINSAAMNTGVHMSFRTTFISGYMPRYGIAGSMVVTPWTAACQTSLSFPISWCLLKLVHWVGDAIQPSHPVIHFFFCLQSFPASGPFPASWLFTSSGQSTEASASALPMTIQGWFPLGLISLIPLLSKELRRLLSSTTIQKHQFFSTQHLWSNSTFILDYWKNKDRSLSQSDVSAL